MEKRTRTYDLEAIKAAFVSYEQLRITATALKNARSMGFSQEDMIAAIQQLKRKDFFKSMTTHIDHRIWQDVYYSEYNGYLLYIKFQINEAGYFIVSFKERET